MLHLGIVTKGAFTRARMQYIKKRWKKSQLNRTAETLKPRNTKGGTITVLLTSCLTGLESAVWQLTIFVLYFQNRLVQTSQTGGQQYNDTSPFSIPYSNIRLDWKALPGTNTALFEQVW